METSQDILSQDGLPGAGDQRRPHILAMPFPLMGHMIPILQLCRMLISKTGCRVTIACNEREVPSLRRLLPAKELDRFSMEVLPISDGLPLDLGPVLTWENFRKRMRAYDEGLSRSFQPHISSFSDVACVISDVYLSWTQDVADQLGVPRIAMWVSAAAEFQVYFHAKELIKAGILPFKAPPGRQEDIDNMIPILHGRPPLYHRVDAICQDTKEIIVPGLPSLNRRDFPTFLQIEDSTDEIFYTFIEYIRTASRASMVLFNSFETLEGTVIDKLRSQGILAQTIGPLSLLEDAILHDGKVLSTSAKNVKASVKVQSAEDEDHLACLKWLDQQKPKSVIYVAFGTTIHLESAQLRELAFGLLNSGHPFIWAYSRPSTASKVEDVIKSEISESFFDRVKDKGLVLEWAPQKRILDHPSIGGFLTHCGWNSTLESISSGVPTLALPFVSDQPLHSKMMVDEWKVGLRLERRSPDKQGLALADDIACLIRELLVGETGSTLQMKAQIYKLAAQSSSQPGNGSRRTLDAIIKIVLDKKKK